MRYLFSFSLLMIITLGVNAQINPQSLVSIHEVSDTTVMNQIIAVANGSLIYNNDDESIYVWQGKNWIPSTNYTEIDNEIFLEDDDYFYVSLKVGSGSFKVVRYDRSDHNQEAVSEGSGTQPIDLISVQSLTYN